MRLLWLRRFSGAVWLATVACSGTVNDGSGRPGEAPDGAGSGGNASAPLTPQQCLKGLHPGPSPIRRLNRLEYNNTIRDLLGDDTRPADAFPAEEIGNGFGNDGSALGVSRLLAESYFNAATAIADRVTKDPARYSKLLGCDPGANEDACAASFIASFGARAFRRPLEEAEKQRLMMVYKGARAGADFREAAKTVVSVVVQMPQFLYRIETGVPVADQPDVSKLRPYELASRLSYMFWGSMPDADLLEAAKIGKLGSKEEVLRQAERMINDPRARSTVAFFHGTLFGLFGLDGLNKNVANFPKFFPELGSLLRKETETFIDHVTWEGDGTYDTLFSAPYSFMNARLAGFYGVKGPAGDAFEKVQLEPLRHAGFLTSGGIMAALTPGTETNPVLRGAWVRNKLFCDPPPDPPSELEVAEPKPDPTLTTRERFAAHQTEPSCKGCHRLLDGIGYAFENYDGLGLWRDMDNSKPVDSSGELDGTDVDGKFKGPVELMSKVRESAQVKRCLADNWMTFGYGRGFDENADACNRASLAQAYEESGGNIKKLLVALTQTDAFLYRPTIAK